MNTNENAKEKLFLPTDDDIKNSLKSKLKPRYDEKGFIIINSLPSFFNQFYQDVAFWEAYAASLPAGHPDRDYHINLSKLDVLGHYLLKDRLLESQSILPVFIEYFNLGDPFAEYQKLNRESLARIRNLPRVNNSLPETKGLVLLSRPDSSSSIPSNAKDCEIVSDSEEESPKLRVRGKTYQYDITKTSEADEILGEIRQKIDNLHKDLEVKKAKLIARENRLEKLLHVVKKDKRHSITYADYLTIQEYKTTGTPQADRDKVAIFLLYTSGMRAGNLKHVTEEHLRKTLEHKPWQYTLIKQRAGSNRTMTFSMYPGLYPLIEAIRPSIERILSPEKGLPLFKDGPFSINRTTLQMRINLLVKAALPHLIAVSSHSFRRGFGEEVFQCSGLDHASKALGHSDSKTTLKYLIGDDQLSVKERENMHEARSKMWVQESKFPEVKTGSFEWKIALKQEIKKTEAEERKKIDATRALTGLPPIGVFRLFKSAVLVPLLIIVFGFFNVCPSLASYYDYKNGFPEHWEIKDYKVAPYISKEPAPSNLLGRDMTSAIFEKSEMNQAILEIDLRLLPTSPPLLLTQFSQILRSLEVMQTSLIEQDLCRRRHLSKLRLRYLEEACIRRNARTKGLPWRHELQNGLKREDLPFPQCLTLKQRIDRQYFFLQRRTQRLSLGLPKSQEEIGWIADVNFPIYEVPGEEE